MADQIYECEARLFQTNQATGKRGLAWVTMPVFSATQMGDSPKRDARNVMGAFGYTNLDRTAFLRHTRSIGPDTRGLLGMLFRRNQIITSRRT